MRDIIAPTHHISIHRMLLFNFHFGWTLAMLMNFNTSYVTVQLKMQAKDKITRGISIHRMLLFNDFMLLPLLFGCCISIHRMLLFNLLNLVLQMVWMLNFNTSYVTVQRHKSNVVYIQNANFNTSYVTVQQSR